jgi:alpha-tubulin suppressor-like RCC1 family protein
VLRKPGADQVLCWGSNELAQLGQAASAGGVTPVTWTPPQSVIMIAAGSQHSCALLADNTVWCWGSNSQGQLGYATGASTYSATPTAVATALLADTIVAYGNNTCLVTSAAYPALGDLYCWGSNSQGQLNQNPASVPSSTTPVLMASATASIGLASNRVCKQNATTNDVQCFGTPASDYALGQALAFGIAVMGGSGFACEALASGGVACFGQNDQGQLGDGTFVNSSTPRLVSATIVLNFLPGLAAGAAHACAIDTGGRVGCWGLNDHGQLGKTPASLSKSSSPVWLNL